MAYTYRLVKGSALSWAELDGNFETMDQQYNTAVTKAAEAATSADEAAASAASALTAPGTNATSTTSMTIGTGSKTFTVQTGKSFVVGQFVVIASTASPSNYMLGQITAYNSGTGSITVAVGTTNGSGTLAAWTVSVSAPNGNFLITDTGLPRLKPTLLLDFANSQTVDSRITFTRATTATRFNSKGLLEVVASGVPRIDYDPLTGTCQGLLIEEARTNLNTYSEDFTNIAWTAFNLSVTGNATVAPDGTTTADKLVENIANNRHYVYQSPSVTSGLLYTTSVFVKAAERSKMRIDAGDGQFGAGNYVDFDLVAGTVTPAGTATGTIKALTNGWYRLSATFTAIATASSAFTYELATTAGSSTYTGDGTSGLFLWGAQTEVGAFATSYIPTTTATVARNADVASMTGTNFSSWYLQTEGTVAFDIFKPVSDTSNRFSIGLVADSSNYLGFDYTSNRLNPGPAYWRNGGTGGITANPAPASLDGNHKYAASYISGDFSASANGGSAVSVVPVTAPPSLTSLVLGGGIGGVAARGAIYIRKFAYYPKRVTNAELIALSSF